jgi:hypothetical protein
MITKIYNNLIWFEYKGDEIAWDGNNYISLGCEGSFPSLEEMDSFWEEYSKEFRRREEEVVITREMAMDAQDLSLEGQIWYW